jgi:hypothetical protein
MSIDRLKTLLPLPTERPPKHEPEAWASVERTLTPLPADYKDFIDEYGPGYVSEFIWVLSPFIENEYYNLMRQTELQLGALRELKAKHKNEVPYDLFPAKGGLLPFALTDNGDVLYWKTDGEPASWSVAVNASRDPECEEFRTDMTDFLADIITRKRACRIFPNDFPSGPPTFQPVERFL